MERYIFKEQIQGLDREILVYPMFGLSSHYQVHWDGREVGVLKKVNGRWHTDSDALSGYVDKLGRFIDHKEQAANQH